MNENNPTGRPPIGFIVEGDGEYNCYPSIVSKILNQGGLFTPIVNANGFGGITRHIDEHLADIISVWKPFSIIVTIDLFDVIKAKVVENCSELRTMISGNIRDWVDKQRTNPKYQPFPEEIRVVIQIQQFESWIIADKGGLRKCGLINLPCHDKEWTNVDEQVKRPCSWLREMSEWKINPKSPEQCRRLMKYINFDDARRYSKSFDKFFRDTTSVYTLWCENCGF